MTHWVCFHRPASEASLNCHSNAVVVVVVVSRSQGKMEIVTSEGQGATARIALTGRLDILGAEEIALPLAALAGAKQGLIVDMSGVSFIASIGLRHLVSA